MDTPHLIYYSDGHHFHAKRIDPPWNLHKLRWPVDELAGTGVDLLTFGMGFSDVYFHDTKIGRRIGDDQEVWDDFINWRIMRMAKDARAMGTDQVREVIKRGRETGLKVFPSFKLQDPSSDDPVWIERFGLLKMKHGKSVCLNEPDDRFPVHQTEWCYDYTNELVRQEKLAMLREMLEVYEADGVELDFMFFPLYFRPAETEASIPVMNAFVSEVRRMANEVGVRQGREIPIMARVWQRRDDNLNIGLDVESWIKAGDVDLVVGQMTGLLLDTGSMEGKWLADAANDAGKSAYLRVDRKIDDARGTIANIEMFRAVGQTAHWQGFAGVSLGYLPWPFDEDEYRLLREMASPEAAARKDKRYFVPPAEAGLTYAAPLERQLPLVLEEGKRAAIKVVIADDVEGARNDGEMREAVLMITFQFFCVEDDVDMRFNGHALGVEDAEVQEPVRGTYWFYYRLPPEVIKRGDNTLEIEITRKEKTAGFARTVKGVEVMTRYKDPERPEGLNPSRVVPPS